jgi:hypothetical protein
MSRQTEEKSKKGEKFSKIITMLKVLKSCQAEEERERRVRFSNALLFFHPTLSQRSQIVAFGIRKHI